MHFVSIKPLMLLLWGVCCRWSVATKTAVDETRYSKTYVADVINQQFTFLVVDRSSTFGIRTPSTRIRCAGACSKMADCDGYFLTSDRKCAFALKQTVPELGGCDVIIPDTNTAYFKKQTRLTDIPNIM